MEGARSRSSPTTVGGTSELPSRSSGPKARPWSTGGLPGRPWSLPSRETTMRVRCRVGPFCAGSLTPARGKADSDVTRMTLPSKALRSSVTRIVFPVPAGPRMRSTWVPARVRNDRSSAGSSAARTVPGDSAAVPSDTTEVVADHPLTPVLPGPGHIPSPPVDTWGRPGPAFASREPPMAGDVGHGARSVTQRDPWACVESPRVGTRSSRDLEGVRRAFVRPLPCLR